MRCSCDSFVWRARAPAIRSVFVFHLIRCCLLLHILGRSRFARGKTPIKSAAAATAKHKIHTLLRNKLANSMMFK